MSEFDGKLVKVERSRTIKVIIADDHPLIREALRDSFNRYDEFEIIAEAVDGEEVIRLASELVPDVVVMDINMPKINGIEATRILKNKLPDVGIVVLTIYEDNMHVFRILEAGADAYLTKEVFSDEVMNAVYGVANGETILKFKSSKEILKGAFDISVKSPNQRLSNSSELFRTLSSQEIAILKLLASGMSNKSIADKLCMSEITIKNYLVNLYNKINVSSRTQAIITALKRGIISLEEIDY